MNKLLQPRTYLRYAKYYLSRPYKRSYSQQGEDLLINQALRYLGITSPQYLDIGAHDPVRSNNTYLMYTRGFRGVVVEPSPRRARALRWKRRGDIVLQKGVASIDDPHAQYFVMSPSGGQFNTFKREEAEQMVRTGSYGKQEISKILSIPLISINTLMAEYFPQGPDVLSLDAEGYDLDILQALDFSRYAPRVLCVETLRYDAAGKLCKVEAIMQLAREQGYLVFADTHTNTIFIREPLK